MNRNRFPRPVGILSGMPRAYTSAPGNCKVKAGRSPSRRRRSIARNLSMGVGLISCLLMSVLLGVMYLKYSFDFETELDRKAEESIERMARLLSVAVWNYDALRIRWIGDEFAHNEFIHSVRVSDHLGAVLFEHKPDDGSAENLIRRRTIYYKAEPVGEVILHLSTKTYDIRMRRLLTGTVVMGVAAVLINLLAAGSLLRAMLRRPLAELEQGMDRIADGDFPLQMDTVRHREFAGIVQRFCEMARTIHRRENALNDANQRMRSEIKERCRAEQVARTLLYMSEAVNTSADLPGLYRRIHQALGRILPADNFFIALHDPKNKVLSFPYFIDEMDEEMPPVTNELRKKLLTWQVISRKTPLMFREEEVDRKAIESESYIGHPSRIWIGAPLRAEKSVLGAVVLQNYHDPDAYSEKDLRLLALISGQIAAAIDRKRIQDALKDSELRFKSLFDFSPQPALLADENMERILAANREFRRLRRLTTDAPACHETGLSELLEKKDRMALARRLSREDEVRGEEISFRQTGGIRRTLLVFARRLEIKEGRVALVLFMDITRQKELDARQRLLQEQLDRSRKMEALGLLAGGVAHDLNNLLLGIVSYPDLLLADLPEDSWMIRPVETIKKSGIGAAAVVSDLLTLTRGVASPRENLDLGDLVREYLESPEFLKYQERYPDVRVAFHAEPDASAAPADEAADARRTGRGEFIIQGSAVHVRKSLMNLVGNAFEAVNGKGHIHLHLTRRFLAAPLDGYQTIPSGSWILLSVADSGGGISAEDRPHIFEPFYTRKIMGRSGSGLGLAVVWNMMRDHSGVVDLQNRDGGAVFDLYFPAAAGPSAAPAVLPEIEKVMGGGERILIVDDDKNQRLIAGDMLKHLGYRTMTAESGEAAVARIEKEPADLVLLDMIMGRGINGRETYERIIRLRPGQKAVIVSGYAETGEVRKALDLGAGCFLKKPYTLRHLGRAVKEILGEKPN